MAAATTSGGSAQADQGFDWGSLISNVAQIGVTVGDTYMQREELKHQQSMAKIEKRNLDNLAAIRQQRANIALQQAESGFGAAKSNLMPLLILGGVGMMGMMMIMMMKK